MFKKEEFNIYLIIQRKEKDSKFPSERKRQHLVGQICDYDLELFNDLVDFAPKYFTFYQEAPAVPRDPFHATLSQSLFRFCPKSSYSVCHDQLRSPEELVVFRKF